MTTEETVSLLNIREKRFKNIENVIFYKHQYWFMKAMTLYVYVRKDVIE